MCVTYGYCRISRKSQNIDRQERNILTAFPSAVIVKEAFTGTKIHGRKELDKIVKTVKAGDTVVFDSASRMSRNADEAVTLYEDLFRRGVRLVFLKEPQIDTDVYKAAIERRISLDVSTGSGATDNFIKANLEAVNNLLIDLAAEQVRLVFSQAEKEVTDLHQRTSEGIATARLNGKQIGQKAGVKLTTRKSLDAKAAIRKYSKDFDGTLSDPEVITLTKISRNTYYKYKKEMKEEIAF